MIDLDKEAEEYANNYFDMHSNHYKGIIEGYRGCAIQSKYVQAEKIKAQIEVLNKIGKKGSNPIDIEEEIFFLQQQLNQL
jgi:hypothetical protein